MAVSSLKTSRIAAAIAKRTGPSTMPNTPNTGSPPSSEKNITNSLSPTRPPTSLGLRKLSTVLITAVPNTARMIARVQCPVVASYTAPGAQTPAAPTTGSTLVTTVTMPHSAADGIPRIQNMPPHSAPWTTAMTTMPYTLP